MRILPILFTTEMVRALQDDMKTATRRVIKYSASDVYKSACFHGRWHEGMTVDNLPRSLIDWYCKEVKRPPYEPGDILYIRETWAVHPCRESDWLTPDLRRKCRKTGEGMGCYIFAADGLNGITPCCTSVAYHKWSPSIHMPKEAARIFLKVKDVRVERLQNSFFAPISPIFDLLAEGMDIGDDCRNCIATYGNPCCVDTVDEDGSNLYGGDCGILDVVRGDYSDLWNRLYAKPMPVKERGVVVRYESYPWEDIQEVRTYRGLPWLVIGNPWVWVIEFERTDKPEGWPHGKA